MTRRSLREATSSKASSGSTRRTAARIARNAQLERTDTAPVLVPPARKRGKSGVLNIVVMTLAAGIVATMAIPAYALAPSSVGHGHFGTSAVEGERTADAQSMAISAKSAPLTVQRDTFTATSPEQIAAAKAQAAAAAAAAAATARMKAYGAAYSGPTAADYLANPPYPNFSLAQVFSVAKQYIGTPYVFGGATPAGFDCSGYVMFVYAQFGISLPHSVSGEAARGTRIATSAAVPGDLVVMSGHIGFYAGNGEIMDAPVAGKSVSIRPIWTSDYYIVRLGI